MTNHAVSIIEKVWNSINSLLGHTEEKLPEGIKEDFRYQHPFNSQIVNGRAQVLPIDRVVA